MCAVINASCVWFPPLQLPSYPLIKMPTPPPRTESASSPREFQLAAIGIDSSHLPQFSRRIRALRESGQTPCRVTQMWTDGDHGMRGEQVEKWTMQAQAEGVVLTEKLDDALDAVDGVMVLGVDGHKHLDFARPGLERGLPTYIDKPLACSLEDAKEILALSRRHDAPCYSASSLRFASEVRKLDPEVLGDLVAVSAYGPGERHDIMPGLYFYGIHTIEMVDAIWPGPVARVRCAFRDDRDLVELEYADGRYAHLRMDRKGVYEFGGTVQGTKGTHAFKVDFSEIYDRLIDGMVRFFEGGPPPVQLERLVENVALIEAAHRSVDADGAWIDVSA